MITDLRVIDDETAAAFGQKFDVRQVLDRGIAFMEAFAAAVGRALPGERMSVRFKGDGNRRQPLDGDAYARLRRETLAIAGRWDVTMECATADIGPFRLKFYPLGCEDLQRIGPDGPPTLVGEESWIGLDPTPAIVFLPAGESALFGRKGKAILKDLVTLHAPHGTRLELDPIPSLRFPHRAFGAGYGVLRISILSVPVSP